MDFCGAIMVTKSKGFFDFEIFPTSTPLWQPNEFCRYFDFANLGRLGDNYNVLKFALPKDFVEFEHYNIIIRKNVSRF